MNYRNVISRGTKILNNNSIKTANIDSEILFSTSIKKSREDIILNCEQKVNYQEIKNYLKLIYRRKQKEPVSLITGNRFFWKYNFKVDKNVLTPRFETEILVEQILKTFNQSENLNVLDVGLGSGCILISLLKDKSKWHGTGLDISNLAIKNAKINAKIQQVDNRIRFINSDIDKFSSSKYDLIVSNPPYINKVGYNNLDLSVKGYEPKVALCGGVDGYKIIDKIIKKSKIILKNTGTLAFEIGSGQHYKVREHLKKNGFYVFKLIEDYQNIKRCILARKIN